EAALSDGLLPFVSAEQPVQLPKKFPPERENGQFMRFRRPLMC
ncbi:hypothetical protein HMPREF9120_00690, partial [Neisseria sp. oral taxon 020 str. F0370]